MGFDSGASSPRPLLHLRDVVADLRGALADFGAPPSGRSRLTHIAICLLHVCLGPPVVFGLWLFERTLFWLAFVAALPRAVVRLIRARKRGFDG